MGSIGEPRKRLSIISSIPTRRPRVAQIRVLGGAIARVRADATAFAHRSRAVMVNVAALYDRAEDAPRYRAWVDAFRVALQKGNTGAYVNFLADDGPTRIHEAYPDPTWDKLRAIKQRYDPANLFRLNQNVPPSAEIKAAHRLGLAHSTVKHGSGLAGETG
jgi:hypothetical protein